jgi:hypothetical protein
MPCDCTPFSLPPKQCLDEVHDAQAALAVAEHYISFCPQTISPSSTYHFYATHEALHEARRAIDRVIELLRAETGRSLQRSDAEPEATTDGDHTGPGVGSDAAPSECRDRRGGEERGSGHARRAARVRRETPQQLPATANRTKERT